MARIRALEGASENLETYLLIAVKDARLQREWQRRIDEIDQGIARLYQLLDNMP